MAIKLATSTLETPSKYTQTYDTFRGVDLTHSKLDVEAYRAVDMRNFIMENETNTKRYGWEELYRFSSENHNINGIWTLDSSYPITDDNGNILSYDKDSIVLVQVANKFYIIRDFGDESEKDETDTVLQRINLNDNIIEVPFNENVDIEKIFANQKSEAYIRGNRLYILCGDFLVFGKWSNNGKWAGNEQYEIRRVYNDIDTYIPTILTKIVCEESEYLQGEETFTTNVALDDRNILTNKAKITLLGEKENSAKQANLVYNISIGYKINKIISIVANGDTLTNEDYNFDNVSNKLTINENYIPTQEGVDNIIVTLEYVNPSEDIIGNCRFGLIYGYNGLRDRLFLSGNPDYPNYVYRSTETNQTEESDFTYFSDLDYIKLGNTNNQVMGMYIQGDGTMVVLKSPSSQEPTIYFIKATMVQATDYQGNALVGLDGNAVYEEAYPVQIGSIGVGLKKRNGIYNLNGDPLMISDNGIYGIVLGSNVASEQRYAKLRSRLIDNSITQIQDLENTACICYKNKFYIADTSTGLCYIADARYPTKLGDDLEDTYQYEWWIWDNIYARLFFEYKEELYMATTIGQICKFKQRNYNDISYRNIVEGGIMYDNDKDLFLLDIDNDILQFETWADYEKLHNQDRLNFNTALDMKILVLDNTKCYTKDNYVYVEMPVTNDEELEKYNDLKITLFLLQTQYIQNDNLEELENVYIVYLDKINQALTRVSENQKYVIKNVKAIEEDANKFTLSFQIATPQQSVEGLLPEISYTPLENCEEPFRISMNMPQDLIIYNLQTENGLLFEKCFKDTEGYWYYYDENNNVISLNTQEMPTFNYFDLTAFEMNNKAVKVITYGETALMNNLPVETPAVLTINNPVNAYYYTTWFNLGTDVYLKNLLNVYVVPDPLAANRVSFAFETSRKKAEYDAYTGKAFDFNDLDFNDVSFTTNQIPMIYQKKFKTKKFSYIRFIFKNNDSNNCKLARVTIEYTTSSKVKGEK